MSAKIADTRFTSGPDEGLAVVDIYSVTDNGVKTGAVAKPNSKLSAVVGEVKVPEGEVEDPVEEEVVESEPVNENKVGSNTTTNIRSPSTKSKDVVVNNLEPKPLDKTKKFVDELKVDVERVKNEIKSLSEPYKGLIDEDMIDTKQQKRMMEGFGLMNSNASTMKVGETVASWFVDGKNLVVKKKCALLGLAGLFVASRGSDNGALLLLLLLLLARFIECFIIEPINEVLGSIGNEKVTSMVAGLALGKAINPLGEKFKRVETGLKNDNMSFLEGGFISALNGGTQTNNRRVRSVNSPETDFRTDTVVNRNTPLVGRNPETSNKVSSDYNPSSPFYGNNDVVVGSIENAIKRPPVNDDQRGADLDVIEVLLEFADLEMVRDAYPSIVGQIFLHYRLPRDRAYSLKEEYEKIIRIAIKLDPDWDVFVRNENSISSIRHLNTASLDLLTVFEGYSESKYKEQALIARSYTYNNIELMLKSQYPFLTI